MTDQTNFVSTSGYNAAGRRIYVNIGFAPDANAFDIAELIATIEAVCQQAGLSVREQGVEAGEKTETVHYVLRSIVENERGTSDKIYLYTERFAFKFLHMYLNSAEDIYNFSQATGLVVTDIPVWDGEVALERGKNPQKDRRYIVSLSTPVQVIYKQNERWEGDEDKKHAKHVFVRWLTTPASPTPLSSDKILSLSKETQRVAKTLGSGDGERRIPAKSQTAGGTSSAAGKQAQQDNGTTKIETVTSINRELRGQSYLIRTPQNCYSYTRQPFTDAGITIEEKQVGRIDLGGSYTVIAEKDSSGYWKITRVEPMGAAEAALFGAAPDFAPGEDF